MVSVAGNLMTLVGSYTIKTYHSLESDKDLPLFAERADSG